MLQELEGKVELYETENGKYWLPKNSEKDIVCQQIKIGKVFDWKIVEELRKIYLERGNPSAIMLDVGANFGQMSVEFTRFRKLLPIVSNEAGGP